MKKILFVYPEMMVGGSTTSLLSILNLIDYTTNRVDLLLGVNRGPWFQMIPSEVHILEQAHPYTSRAGRLLRVLPHPEIALAFIKARTMAFKHKNLLISHQIMAYQKIKMDRVVDTYYDIAISFLECWPTAYVSAHVKADTKIAWLHLDYVGSGLIPEYDKSCYKKFDKIVLVSSRCKDKFDQVFPECKNNSVIVENILCQETIREYSKASNIEINVDKNYTNIVTTCRIVFSHKGIDRAVKALSRLKKSGIELKIKWYIIGDGPDYDKLNNLIRSKGLEDYVILLGQQNNPFVYMKNMDLFFLPSYYEGKPMSVTEAHMLGLPAFVTNYASAAEQVEHGIDGIIIRNDEEHIYQTLLNLNNGKYDLIQLRHNTNLRNYSNLAEFGHIKMLIG